MELKLIDGREKMTEARVGKNGVPFLTFKPLEKFTWLRNGFSTREGGVSEDIFKSLNLAHNRGDKTENIVENFKLIGEAMEMPAENMVYAQQTHTTTVLTVDHTRCGMGVLKDRDFHDVDALVTDDPGVVLVTGHADCIPLFFVDPVHKAIGLAHAGWKGTINNIAAEVIREMYRSFKTDPEELVVVIGPGVCGNCYEVGEDVASQFRKKYDTNVIRTKVSVPGKYTLDLHLANMYNMQRAGVPEENIHVSDVCTMENPDVLFSHRATDGKRGGCCAFLEII
ncbi:conserved hypothetical protein [Lachnospiraceae bacterium]|nr:conserved hypothetical protein [Lachnospiraceae bacterium]